MRSLQRYPPQVGQHVAARSGYGWTARLERARTASIASPSMRLVIARCSVDYAGRLSTHLPSAVRLLMVKADGSVLVHADGGGYKPLNWMSAPCTLVVDQDVWRISNRTGETGQGRRREAAPGLACRAVPHHPPRPQPGEKRISDGHRSRGPALP